jgi:hypothetical protein
MGGSGISDDDHMSHDLERELRASLRPVDPGDDFSPKVMARIAREAAPPAPSVRPARRRWTPAAVGWLGFALAASVVLSVLIAHEWQARRTAQGLEARRQLIEALRVTDEKLDLASRVINSTERTGAPEDSGA